MSVTRFTRVTLCIALCIAFALIAQPIAAQTKVAVKVPATSTAKAGPLASSQLTIPQRGREILAQLIAINTAASTGGITPAATAMAARFRAAGVPDADIHVVGPNLKNRNLVVRLRGKSKVKPVLFISHLDVVEAPKLDWGTDPFRLTEKDGWLYGRGVLDDKGPASALVTGFLELARTHTVPSRDLILALTAGEETDIDNGVMWLIANQRALVDAEFVINADAGLGEKVDGKVQALAVQAAEKVYMDLTLTARGPGGHSSRPSGITPIDHLSRALAKLGEYKFPIHVNDIARSYLERRAPITGGEVGGAMAALAKNTSDSAAANLLVQNTEFNALLRTTCIATMLRGGTAANAIPQEVSATVNCRILPGEPADEVIATIRRVIGDTSVVISVLEAAKPSPPSIPPAALVDLLEKLVGETYPHTPVIPYMETGATDGLHFRNIGIPVFGVIGMFVDPTIVERMHGRDERVPSAAYDELVVFTTKLIRAIGELP